MNDYPDLDLFTQYPPKFTLFDQLVMLIDWFDDGGW